MKSKQLIFIVFALISINAFSQVKLGVRAGVSSSSIYASDITDVNYKVSTLSNTKVGFQFGLMSQITLLGMYLQPEFLFSSSGGEVAVRDNISNITSITNQRFNKLDIPVIIGKKMGFARLGLGPVASIILNKPSDLVEPGGTSFAAKFNGATFGFQIDMGLDIWKLAIDLKYEGNLSKLGSGVNVAGQQRSFDSRNSQLIFGVGLFF
jgi:hypothetical protein